MGGEPTTNNETATVLTPILGCYAFPEASTDIILLLVSLPACIMFEIPITGYLQRNKKFRHGNSSNRCVERVSGWCLSEQRMTIFHAKRRDNEQIGFCVEQWPVWISFNW